MTTQSQARRRASRAQTRRASSSSMIFRLSFPPGRDGCDQLDWRDLQRRGLAWARFREGHWHMDFVAPFDALSFVHGETVTTLKMVELRLALDYFGALLEEMH